LAGAKSLNLGLIHFLSSSSSGVTAKIEVENNTMPTVSKVFSDFDACIMSLLVVVIVIQVFEL
jgi:hypothetical protein